jgi:hypothetical protein
MEATLVVSPLGYHRTATALGAGSCSSGFAPAVEIADDLMFFADAVVRQHLLELACGLFQGAALGLGAVTACRQIVAHGVTMARDGTWLPILEQVVSKLLSKFPNADIDSLHVTTCAHSIGEPERMVKEAARIWKFGEKRAPEPVPEAPNGLLGGVVGGLDVGRRLLLPLGAVEFQNRVEGDFAHALLDGEVLAYSFSYSRVRSSLTS